MTRRTALTIITKAIAILLACALMAPAAAAEQPDLNMDDLREFSRRFIMKHQPLHPPAPAAAAEAPKAPAIRLSPPVAGTMPNVTPTIPDSVKRPIIFPRPQKRIWI